MFDLLWNLGSFIVALGLLVTVHEYGHFWVARKCGVKVERFSIGFGKTLWRTHDKHGTEFVIALLPLGGFVKMLDGRVDDITESEKQFAFNHKSVYQRIAIVAAGPIANFLFAIVAFYLMFLIGMSSVKPIIGEVTADSIASQAQLQPNTQIVAINDKQTQDWNAVQMALVGQIGEPNVSISTQKLDSTYINKQQLNTSEWQFEPSKESAMASLGIKPFIPNTLTKVARLEAGAAGDKAGLKLDDEIISANGENIYGNWQGFVDIIQQNPNTLIPVELFRDSEKLTIEVFVGTRAQSDGHKVGYIGVSPIVEAWPDEHRIEISYGPIEAISKATASTWNLITLSFDMVGKLITGHVSVDNLSGPISIAQGAGNSAGYGLVYFLSFLALISINLGIINLLPLPILDGGHLLYYFIELISGKPVPEKFQEVGFKIGALILLSLMSIAIFNDFSRL